MMWKESLAISPGSLLILMLARAVVQKRRKQHTDQCRFAHILLPILSDVFSSSGAATDPSTALPPSGKGVIGFCEWLQRLNQCQD
jgi:hypothetical protein